MRNEEEKCFCMKKSSIETEATENNNIRFLQNKINNNTLVNEFQTKPSFYKNNSNLFKPIPINQANAKNLFLPYDIGAINQINNINNKESLDNKDYNKGKLCCTCTKTKCQKKYCECYASQRYCTECLCQDCLNKPSLIKEDDINKNKAKNFAKIICTCTKTFCNKKYCECYKAGIKCNNHCRCSNCMNTDNKINLCIGKENLSKSFEKDAKIIDLDEKELNEPKIEEKKEISIQRISVFICKTQTLINIEKYSKDEFFLLNKKRKNISN